MTSYSIYMDIDNQNKVPRGAVATSPIITVSSGYSVPLLAVAFSHFFFPVVTVASSHPRHSSYGADGTVLPIKCDFLH